jgi:alpha-2-macroglobulin
MYRKSILAASVSLILVVAVVAIATPKSVKERRKLATKEYNDGNYRDSFELYEQLLLKEKGVAEDQVPLDYNMALNCLRSLGEHKNVDSFREKVVKRHADNWGLLWQAARSFFHGHHYGTIIAGTFERGYHRGGGRYVNTVERDRVAALALMDRARAIIEGDAPRQPLKTAARPTSDFYREYANMLIGYRGYQGAWRLLYLTDMKELPDYVDGYHYYQNNTPGAPVDEEGKPIFHKVPDSFAAAKTDGERWRHFLKRAIEVDPSMKSNVLYDYANFLYNQFGVQTMAYYGRSYGQSGATGEDDEKDGPFTLHTLAENESVARLATGITRFKMPDDANYLLLYKELKGWTDLAQIFENRRQYPKAADYWKKAGYKDNVDQILGNWGQFHQTSTYPAGSEPVLAYRFRNGEAVSFEAHAIDVRRLLKDVKSYLKSSPRNLDWNKMNIANIGYRLVHEGQTKYLLDRVAKWSLDLKPREQHFDTLVTVKTPLSKAGAYLVTAKLKNGNVSKIVVWVDNTVIVRKQLDGASYFFVGDSVTGKVLPEMTVEFFGYKQKYINAKWPAKDYYKTTTRKFKRTSDKNGQVIVKPGEYSTDYNWLISTTTKSRLAYMGFTGIWYGNYYDYEYNQTKVFTITDRPVYRPNQAVKYKFWLRHAKYDQEDTSSFANQSFTVRIHNPKGEKVLEENKKSDEWGGLDGEYLLPDDATLGVYSVQIVNYGGSSFRVEEYKKPEFEVTVEAPDKPVMLGEKIVAKIKAKYYFGSPVAKGKVKYKVLRYTHNASWYPSSYWDWFYGAGYWWFGYDYGWWPGWHHWGMSRPVWWWWGSSSTPPEVVAEAEVKVGPNGEVKVPIDTAAALAFHPDQDHRYEITAEVTDESRRTIVGVGKVLVARRPFKVYAWVDRGHYQVGDVVHANFQAQTLDSKPVVGAGELTLYKVSYDANGQPTEKVAQQWSLPTNDRGTAELQMKASRAGQYRLSYKVTDSAEHVIEGGYVFVVRGSGFDGKDFRFNEIELVPDKKEYAPGEKVKLMVNTDRAGATVVLFLRPANGTYLEPEVLRLKGKSTVYEIKVTKKDMPNFFVEAFSVYNGKLYTDTREIVVPPEKRIINVEVEPNKTEYLPGEKASVRVKLTDLDGKPFVGSTVLAVYDKAVEYISGGSNVPAIRPFFWKWRRSHYPRTESTMTRVFSNITLPNKIAMRFLGVFGHMVQPVDDSSSISLDVGTVSSGGAPGGGGGKLRDMKKSESRAAPAAPRMLQAMAEKPAEEASRGDRARNGDDEGGAEQQPGGPGAVQPTVRTNFADTAFWAAALETDKEGIATVTFDMPENLSGWKVKTWAMGHGTKVGESTVEVVTRKNLMLRLQAPRFFVEKDEVVLSANVHNYLKTEKEVTVVLELDGPSIKALDEPTRTLTIGPGGEERIDWRVKVLREGEAIIRMKALTDEESDAMEMRFPVFVHGMLKTDSYSGVIRPDGKRAAIKLTVPSERRVEQSRLELRYSPTLAGAMVDALPYLVEYPYGCTEQTLNRFLPTVITQKILQEMDLDLKDIRDKQSNLNAQEIGNDKERAKQWQRWDRSPVFSEKEVNKMVKKGLFRLQSMQLSDGGWGWFSGWGEYSYPHTTATVVHGLQIAKQNGRNVDSNTLARGVAWLENYEKKQVRLIKRGRKKKPKWPYKSSADNLDAFVYMVMSDAGKKNDEMREFLYQDRKNLALYGKAMYGMALHTQKYTQKLDMIMRNIEQFLKQDEENQTAWLDLGNTGYWWNWYGSEYEAQAYYLKLLSRVDPKSEKASRLVKYLLNNRKHATYWNSTRDTAICVEAFADYLRASGEHQPDMTLKVLVDGKQVKSVKIDRTNLFSFDNKLVLEGTAVTSGQHTVELVREGKGPVYFNAYLTNFTLEDFITKAGLEIKVQRKYYKLNKVDKTIKVAGSKGQALDQKVEKYEREELKNWSKLKSGDLVEIELEIDSKNDYEYVIFEDMKAAGFEPVEVRSGYSDNKGMAAYREFRDEKVAFFVRTLARGKHSMAYRMRAEIPGKFSALPTRAYAMYAPELKGNSDEIKIEIVD